MSHVTARRRQNVEAIGGPERILREDTVNLLKCQAVRLLEDMVTPRNL